MGVWCQLLTLTQVKKKVKKTYSNDKNGYFATISNKKKMQS